MRKSILLFAVIGALAIGLAAGPASALTIESKPYIGPVGDLTVLCPAGQGAPTALGLGGNCFTLTAADDTVVVIVDDTLVEHVGFQLGFFTSSSARLGAFRTGCDNGTFAVPDNAVQARVFIDGPVNGAADCAGVAGGPPGIGITGLIGLVRLP